VNGIYFIGIGSAIFLWRRDYVVGFQDGTTGDLDFQMFGWTPKILDRKAVAV
jgi:hypothetical protein